MYEIVWLCCVCAVPEVRVKPQPPGRVLLLRRELAPQQPASPLLYQPSRHAATVVVEEYSVEVKREPVLAVAVLILERPVMGS